RSDVRPYPNCRNEAESGNRRAARGHPPARRVHVALLSPESAFPDAAEQRESSQGPAPQDVEPDCRNAFAVRRDDRRPLAAWRARRGDPRRNRPGAALHLDRRTVILLSVEQPYAVDDLRSRPVVASREGRAVEAHDRAGRGRAPPLRSEMKLTSRTDARAALRTGIAHRPGPEGR